MSEILLRARDISVRFGSLLAVAGVSLDLGGGDLLGLIGPNGAGKTTLLRALCGLQPMRSGEVRILGQVFRAGATELLRRVGFTPDTPLLYEELTVRQFLRFIARGYDLAGAEIDERIDFWLERVWLMEKAEQKIKQLSRGMRQRVGIARTLLPNPTVILLDEPAAGLDPAGRVQFRQLLVSLREQGKAIIISSHILADMDEYCTHIGIMSAGAMVRLGTVAEVASHAGDRARCRYAVSLAHPVAGLREVLQAIAGLEAVEVDGQRCTVEYSSERDDAARLLKELIAREIPVASFAPMGHDLEEAYLRVGVRQVD